MPIPILAVASTVWGIVPRWGKIALGGALALFVTYQVGHWRGDNHRNEIWVAKIRAERQAQEKIIDETKDKAIAEVVRLNALLEEQNAQITVLLAEADADANATRPALGVDSVRRINRGRQGGPK